MKKVLFIDRDGTIIREPESDYQVDALDKFSFFPGAITYMSKIAKEFNYELVLVTNQDGLGTSSFPESDFWPLHELMLDVLKGEGVTFRSIHIDRSFEKDNSPYRKPGTAMLKTYMDGDFDLNRSFVIGDRWSDSKLAQNLGAKGIFLHEKKGSIELVPDELINDVALTTDSWKVIYEFLKQQDRTSFITRSTAETKIAVDINLDGSGQAEIETGLFFFDHMLEQIAKHGAIDLRIKVDGDLHVDEHHTVEDTAIALGAAMQEALGKKVGIKRYGFNLPMDDCLAQVAIDFGGRPWLVWDVNFTRERIGDVPTEMFYHFFKTFTDHAKCNLNVKVEGENEHHKIESVFKAFARAIRHGIEIDQNNSDVLPTTKGML